ncbi:hypothetical protein PISMIDRAFT_683376 [Pisolithus microcarpus 441]|uniref:Unplaced genomic scaffold scaffold_103, whole genome shotgun sequence n=1 Tax=Pisolithus microcarpus 441 TaxID=765257 RepID=A0A0C9ZH22_9AGAM|nr:hypothetical protein PISMIDRAFT_683376 [Pisolithus microcarpus 441]
MAAATSVLLLIADCRLHIGQQESAAPRLLHVCIFSSTHTLTASYSIRRASDRRHFIHAPRVSQQPVVFSAAAFTK